MRYFWWIAGLIDLNGEQASWVTGDQEYNHIKLPNKLRILRPKHGEQ